MSDPEGAPIPSELAEKEATAAALLVQINADLKVQAADARRLAEIEIKKRGAKQHVTAEALRPRLEEVKARARLLYDQYKTSTGNKDQFPKPQTWLKKKNPKDTAENIAAWEEYIKLIGAKLGITAQVPTEAAVASTVVVSESVPASKSVAVARTQPLRIKAPIPPSADRGGESTSRVRKEEKRRRPLVEIDREITHVDTELARVENDRAGLEKSFDVIDDKIGELNRLIEADEKELERLQAELAALERKTPPPPPVDFLSEPVSATAPPPPDLPVENAPAPDETAQVVTVESATAPPVSTETVPEVVKVDALSHMVRGVPHPQSAGEAPQPPERSAHPKHRLKRAQADADKVHGSLKKLKKTEGGIPADRGAELDILIAARKEIIATYDKDKKPPATDRDQWYEQGIQAWDIYRDRLQSFQDSLSK